MTHTLHVVFDENRHVIQQSQCDASAQRASFREIDQILQTKAQRHALREFYRDIIGGVLGIIVGFQCNLSITNITLAGKFDTSFGHVDCDRL